MAQEPSQIHSHLWAMARQLPAVVWTVDLQLRFTSSIGGGLSALGLQEQQVVGLSLFEYFQTEDRTFKPIESHLQALAGEATHYEIEFAGRMYETHTQPFRDADGTIVGALGISVDVTERKRAEVERAALQVQLRDHQKLETLGRLAAGVAHEVNNPVQSIMNFAQIIRTRTNDPAMMEFANEILHEAQRVANIVLTLQTFVRQGDELPVEVDVPELVRRTLSLFAAELRQEHIGVVFESPERVAAVWCRPQGIQQVSKEHRNIPRYFEHLSR